MHYSKIINYNHHFNAANIELKQYATVDTLKLPEVWIASELIPDF
ncbi:hypothetical protein PPEP_b0379 [Pseudoalteromonas peptidolytica F12-50-A1]|uniref:Uncharacterized protein n=1 Tax=Pseudoalteromonas peptidolytica F12-50-A1 TaxID=1315280 RepID=A0A8I0MYY1_9GAMM|nr:hypothetical protein [Pseudoalteromonas peptidolytica F12-50-A1]GEK11867.1 hypothetical protein PPE03_41160 [Pseudoalteromonas peptidolytica]